MTNGAFPAGWALMKPQQTIEPAEFERLWAQGNLIPTRKRDGNRAHVITAGAQTRIYSRNGTLDWTDKVPHIARAFAAAEVGYLIDIELHTMDEGTTSFQTAMNSDPEKIYWSAFDVIKLDGSHHHQPYGERRKLIKAIEDQVQHRYWGGGVDYDLPANASYADVLTLIENQGFEGLVMWDATAPHIINTNGNTKRGRAWKIKIRQTEDLVVTAVNACGDPSLGCGTLKVARLVEGKLFPVKAPVGSFEVSFDRRAALSRALPFVVEIAHYGEDENQNLVFPKITRMRDDLHSDFGIAA